MTSVKTIRSVNEFAHQYDEYIENCHWVGPTILFKMMLPEIKRNETLLDIGIGTGLASKPFIDAGLKIYGVDGSEQMINICREKGFATGLKTIDLTIDTGWFTDLTFDHAVSHAVFHLIGDLAAIFGQTSRGLKTGGLFAFTFEEITGEKDGYLPSPIPGIDERLNLPSGIMVYRHSQEYIAKLLSVNGLVMQCKNNFVAFIEPGTGTQTRFCAMLVKKL